MAEIKADKEAKLKKEHVEAQKDMEIQLLQQQVMQLQETSKTGALATEMMQWAKEQPEHQSACAENAEGAGAAAGRQARETITRFVPSARAVSFRGEPGERDEEGSRSTSPGRRSTRRGCR